MSLWKKSKRLIELLSIWRTCANARYKCVYIYMIRGMNLYAILYGNLDEHSIKIKRKCDDGVGFRAACSHSMPIMMMQERKREKDFSRRFLILARRRTVTCWVMLNLYSGTKCMHILYFLYVEEKQTFFSSFDQLI